MEKFGGLTKQGTYYVRQTANGKAVVVNGWGETVSRHGSDRLATKAARRYAEQYEISLRQPGGVK